MLDEMGHGELAARRLGTVLRTLKGPASTLTPLLKGLDAAELIAKPAPDLSAQVVYEAVEEESATAAHRGELNSMKLMALYAVAMEKGVDVTHIEQAMEQLKPKEELIRLVLERQLAQDAEASESLRRDLGGLKLLELRQRALVSEDIDDSQLEDAMEAEQPKMAIVELLVSAMGSDRL